MNLLRKIQYGQYWNIGFCEQTPEEFVREKKLRPVKWLKHPYHDRWFADPFIYRVTEREIVVFVEECPLENPKGIICELVIDRETMRLKERHVLLELNTHLSYPAIIHYEGIDYVYPENGASGKLNMYEYDGINHKLVNPISILDEAVADATIIRNGDCFMLSATKFPETQEKAYLYTAESLFGPFILITIDPYQSSIACSRQGGNYFKISGGVYRPAQNCVDSYGGALTIMKSTVGQPLFEEAPFCDLTPIKGRFGKGLHTLNFSDGLCVVDGYGYYFPILGKLYYAIRKLIGKSRA